MSANNAVIRDATEADIPDLRAILPNVDHLRRIRSCDGGRARYLVAEYEGHVVGFGRISFEILPDRPAGRPRPPLPWIANLNVRADCRGRGFGTLIIRGLERAARERGLSVAYIGVNKDNAPAYSLYSRLGYKPVDYAPARPETSASGAGSVIYMVKPLA